MQRLFQFQYHIIFLFVAFFAGCTTIPSTHILSMHGMDTELYVETDRGRIAVMNTEAGAFTSSVDLPKDGRIVLRDDNDLIIRQRSEVFENRIRWMSGFRDEETRKALQEEPHVRLYRLHKGAGALELIGDLGNNGAFADFTAADNKYFYGVDAGKPVRYEKTNPGKREPLHLDGYPSMVVVKILHDAEAIWYVCTENTDEHNSKLGRIVLVRTAKDATGPGGRIDVSDKEFLEVKALNSKRYFWIAALRAYKGTRSGWILMAIPKAGGDRRDFPLVEGMADPELLWSGNEEGDGRILIVGGPHIFSLDPATMMMSSIRVAVSENTEIRDAAIAGTSLWLATHERSEFPWGDRTIAQVWKTSGSSEPKQRVTVPPTAGEATGMIMKSFASDILFVPKVIIAVPVAIYSAISIAASTP